jgi:putative nucleotidyltransferase with HDIG domain
VSKEDVITIQAAQLQLGMYVYIDLGWMDHPFPMNRFKIKSEEQIQTIRALGIKNIRYSPANSDVLPLSAKPVLTAPVVPEISPELAAMLQEKQEQRVRLEQHLAKVRECEKIISNAAKLVRTINSDIFSRPKDCMASAHKLIDSFLDILMSDNGTVLFALSDKLAGEEIYVHSVNVSVLATLVAKELKVPPDDIKLIGMGCLFHDIGKLEIPTKVTLKIDPLTLAEKSLLQEHTNYGENIARNAMLDPAALAIVAQHHEYIDGTGYPNKLKQDKISLLAQLVAIINLYDNLCNPINPALALTPHEALSTLYTQYRTKLNVKILQVFIRFMGVYPPGSVVSLSDGTIGIIVSVSSGKSMRPTLLIYDPNVPKEEAILLDMETLPDVNISKAIRPALLSPEVFAYLSPRKRATYFFDATKI